MVQIKITGLEEAKRKLNRLSDDIQIGTERKLREAANRIVLSAQMKCPDPELRGKITSRVLSAGKQISIEISAPKEARLYLEQAFDENKDSIPREVADAVKRAIEK